MRITPHRVNAMSFTAAACALLTLCLLAPAPARAQWTQPDASNNIGNTNAGNVGVGTTAPAFRFEVRGAPSRNSFAVTGDGDAVGYAGIKIQAFTTTGIAANRASQFNLHMRKDSWYGGDGSGPSFVIETVSKGGGFAAPFLITPINDVILNGGTGASGLSYGRVGVGTTSPAANLHVHSPSAFAAVRVSGAGGALMHFYDTAAGPDQKLYQWRSEGGLFRLALVNDLENAFVRQNILVANSGGNVGVGTAAPGVRLAVGGAGGNVYGTDLWVENNLHVQGNETLAQGGGRGRMRVGTAWGYLGLYAENSSAGGANDLVLGAGSGLVRVGPDAGVGAPSMSLVVPNGRVGIGTAAPTQKLEVVGGVRVSKGAGGVGGDLSVEGAITGGTISATYQDVAEWVPSTQKLTAGTVVVLDTGRANHVIASGAAYDTKVAGVVSAAPGVLLGVAGEGKVKVATTGRVRVKVDATRAPIGVGDLLVTSEVEGMAMRSVPVDLGGTSIHRPGTIIGKALEPLEKGAGEILVLLSLQ